LGRVHGAGIVSCDPEKLAFISQLEDCIFGKVFCFSVSVFQCYGINILNLYIWKDSMWDHFEILAFIVATDVLF
jgi:hypothetical protein